MDSGVDSLSSVELRNHIQSEFNVSIDSTLLFDYPTINDIVLHVCSYFENNVETKEIKTVTFEAQEPIT